MADVLVPSPNAIRWTRDDCAKLEAAGILTYRYELVEGAIIKLGQNIGHTKLVHLIMAWLVSVFGIDYVLSQTSIDVSSQDNPTNAPEPDAMLLNRSVVSLFANPTPDDILLLVEASDSTLRYDLTTKASLYARADIKEYWVVSLPDRALTVHLDPRDGAYQNIRTYNENQQVAPLAAPEKSVAVAQLLPQADPQSAG